MSTRTHLPLTPTFLDGLLLFVNAIPDAALVIDCANCGGDKFAMIGMQHDFLSTMTHVSGRPRVRFSDLKANDMVLGTDRKMREAVQDIVATRKPSIVFLVQSSVAQLIGTDIDRQAQDLESEFGVTMAVVLAKPLSGDFLDGVSAGMDVLAQRLPLRPSLKQNALAIVGNSFERFEADQQGNLAELRRMNQALGFETPSIWLDGSRIHELSSIGHAATLVSLPQGGAAATLIAARTGARRFEAPLPIGLDGSVRYVRVLSEALDRKEQAEQYIERELDIAVPRLEKIVRRTFLHRSAAVVAEPDQLVGLCAWLAELGMTVQLAVALTRKEAHATRVRDDLAIQGISPQIIVDPTFPLVQDALRDLRAAGKLDVVIGSGSARDAAKPLGVPYLEFCHPCYVRHALFDSPWLGFRGALWMADAMFNLLNEREYQEF